MKIGNRGETESEMLVYLSWEFAPLNFTQVMWMPASKARVPNLVEPMSAFRILRTNFRSHSETGWDQSHHVWWFQAKQSEMMVASVSKCVAPSDKKWHLPGLSWSTSYSCVVEQSQGISLLWGRRKWVLRNKLAGTGLRNSGLMDGSFRKYPDTWYFSGSRQDGASISKKRDSVGGQLFYPQRNVVSPIYFLFFFPQNFSGVLTSA